MGWLTDVQYQQVEAVVAGDVVEAILGAAGTAPVADGMDALDEGTAPAAAKAPAPAPAPAPKPAARPKPAPAAAPKPAPAPEPAPAPAPVVTDAGDDLEAQLDAALDGFDA